MFKNSISRNIRTYLPIKRKMCGSPEGRVAEVFSKQNINGCGMRSSGRDF
jgi:hypothetical protein